MTPSRPAGFQIQNAGVLCRGSSAPSPTRNAALPSLVHCPDGSLLVAHRIGTHKNSADGTQWLWRSRDEGATWQRVPFPFTKTPAGGTAEFRTAALSEVGHGQIAMLLTWLDHPDDTAPLVNASTEGLLPIHIGWAMSSDNGENWTVLREIEVAPLVQPAGNGPMVRLPNRDLLVAFETYKHYDDPSPWSARSAIALSQDEGKTWKPIIVAADPTHQVSYFDQHLHVLSDGSLLDVMWLDDRRRPGVSEIGSTHSSDGGQSWLAPSPTGLHGQFSTLIRLRDGRLLMFYVVRHGDSAMRIALGSSDGTRWRTRDDWVLYSQRANDLARVNGKDFADYLQNMARWTFGWPSAVELRDGTVIAAYYAGEGDRSSVHLARLTPV